MMNQDNLLLGNGLNDMLFVKTDSKLVQVSVGEIYCIESEGNYITLYTSKKKYVAKHSLKGILSLFPKQIFAQIHRNIAVQVRHIQQIELQENTVQLKDGTSHPVTRNYKSALLDLLPKI